MNVLIVAFMLIHAAVAIALLVAVGRSLWDALSLFARRTVPIGGLHEGLARIRGTVRSCGDSMRALSGRECLAVRVTIESRAANGKESLSTREATRCEAFEVVDETGCCVVRARQARVLGPGIKTEMTIGGLREAAPEWVCKLAHDKASIVTVREHIVQAGDAVLLHGNAAMSEERPGEGYRDGKQMGWRLTTPPQSELLIAVGSRGGLVLRAMIGPMVALIAVAGMIACIWAGVRVLAS